MRKPRLVAGAILAGAALFVGGALLAPRAENSVARQLGEDPEAHAQRALTYLQAAREEADPSLLPRAEDALRRSRQLRSQDNLEAFVGMASLSNARHDFSTSVKWSRRAIDTNPHNAAAYGLLGDALFELGKVAAADAAYQEMVDRRPDVASYVRASYALQYHGETQGALQAMRAALRAAGPTGETAAWVRHQMGDIYAGLGKTSLAEEQNRIGIAIAPGYIPPTVGLAEAMIARGKLERATAIMERAVADLPSLEYGITLGDLYRALGRAEDARDQYEAVAEKLAEYRASGMKADADFIVFYADHGLRPVAGLREARAIYANRPTPKTADALAWMLHSLDRSNEAWPFAQEAIASRARDADMLFHAGRIAKATGRDRLARDLVTRAFGSDIAFANLNERSDRSAER
jgi:tetratricopeptide (TPR) repeat protein